MSLIEKNKIKYVYFIMSVLVILIHSINNETKFQLFFSESGIGQFAVPLFFIISGFLFFRTAYTKLDVRRKLHNKIYTLLIPYLLWNLIYYAIHLLLKPGQGISINEAFEAAFNYKYNPSFWFIYQLILLNIISPLLYYVIKKDKYMVLLFVALSLMILFKIDLPYINEDAIIYYFSGAIFSKIYNRGKVSFISKKYFVYSFVISVLIFTANRFLYNAMFIDTRLVPLFTLSTIYARLSISFTIFYLIDLFFSYSKMYGFMEHTFFLYAIHFMIVKAMIIFMKFLSYKFLPVKAFIVIETIVFVSSPMICIFINYYLTRFMKKRFNKTYNILTGDR